MHQDIFLNRAWIIFHTKQWSEWVKKQREKLLITSNFGITKSIYITSDFNHTKNCRLHTKISANLLLFSVINLGVNSVCLADKNVWWIIDNVNEYCAALVRTCLLACFAFLMLNRPTFLSTNNFPQISRPKKKRENYRKEKNRFISFLGK